MAFPKSDEYNAAVQNPKVCFSDEELRTGKVQENSMGLPFPYSGGFTTTYKVFTDNTTYAARCFIRDVRNLVARYGAISDFRLRSKCPYLVDADVLRSGILVGGKWHSIIKMRWVEGDLLNVYIEKLLNRDQQDLEEFLIKFEKFAHQLEKDEFAHGDLQHGNIIIKNDKIYLIDYDGIYLPEIESLGTGEVGHPNYQHPNRTTKCFDRNLDRFSVIVTWLSIKSLAHKSDLWKKYNNGENLLFRKDDFQDPENSELFYRLSQVSELAEDAQKFAAICRAEFTKIPPLQSFIDGNFSYTKHTLKKPAKTEVKTISSKEHDVFNKLYGAASQAGIKTVSGTFQYSPTTTLSGETQKKSNSTSGFHAKLQAKMKAGPAPVIKPPTDNTMANRAVWLMKKFVLLLVIISVIFVILAFAQSNSETKFTQVSLPATHDLAVVTSGCPSGQKESPSTHECIPQNDYCVETEGPGSIWDGNFCTSSCGANQCQLANGTCLPKDINSHCNDYSTDTDTWTCNAGYYEVKSSVGGAVCRNADELNSTCSNNLTNSHWDGENPLGGKANCICPAGPQWSREKTECKYDFDIFLNKNIDDTKMIAPNGANLRACPSVDCMILEKHPANTVFVASMLYGKDESWYKVRTPNIKSPMEPSLFWVRADLLRAVTPGDVSAGYTASVEIGSLTLARSPDSPSGFIVGTASAVTLAKFKVKANHEKLRLDSIRVSQAASDASWQRIRNGAIFLNGVQVGLTADICEKRTTCTTRSDVSWDVYRKVNLLDGNSTHPSTMYTCEKGVLCETEGYTQYNFGSGIILEADAEYVLEVRGDIYNGNSATPVFGGTATTITLEHSFGNIYRLSSPSEFGNEVVVGNRLTVMSWEDYLKKYPQ